MISISSVVNSAFFTLGLKSHAPKDGTKLGVKVGLENVKSPDMNNWDTDAEGVKIGIFSGKKFNVFACSGATSSSLETDSVALKNELSS